MLKKKCKTFMWICTKPLNLYFLSCELKVNFVTVLAYYIKYYLSFYSKLKISRRSRYIKSVYITTSNRQIRALLY
jgi:hypothetical protein